MKETLLVSSLGGAFSFVVMFLFALFAKIQHKTWILLILGLLVLDFAVTMLPNAPLAWLNLVEYNWQGKALSILWAMLFFTFTGFLTSAESGITWKINAGAWVPFFLLCVLAIGIQVWDCYNTGLENLKFNKEALFYEATMPGFAEELVYRGIILGLLNKVYGSRVNILGASLGYGVLIQAIIFGGGHAFYFDDAGAIQFALVPAVITGLIGLILGWMKERSGSLVMPVLLHNIFNSTPGLLACICS